jgi:hypothetical protein
MRIKPKSSLQRITPDIGFFCAPDYAHAHNRKNPLSSACAFTHKIYLKLYLSNIYGKKFLLRHFFGQVLNRKNPSFIRASLLSKDCFISPRFYLLEFKITSNLEKYFCGFIHVLNYHF